MLGCFIFAVAVGPADVQPGNHDNAPTEAAVAPAIFRKFLLVRRFFISSPKQKPLPMLFLESKEVRFKVLANNVT